MKPFTTGHLRADAGSRAGRVDAERLPRARPGRPGGAHGQEREHPVSCCIRRTQTRRGDQPRQLNRTGGGRRASLASARRSGGGWTSAATFDGGGRRSRAAYRCAAHAADMGPRTAASRRCSSCCRCSSSSARSRGTRSCAPSSCRCSTRTSSEPATWVGLDNFRAVIHDPLLPIGGQEHGVLRPARAGLRLPDPARRSGPDERGAQAARHLQRARLPAGRDPARRRRAALEDVLRRELRRRLQHRPRLGRTSARIRGSSRSNGRCRRSSSSRPGRTRAGR